MRRLVWLIALAASAADIGSQAYLKDVQYLASPELKGRATGSPELEKAAHWISGLFQSFGLKPVDGKSFELPFPVVTGAHLGADNDLSGARSGDFQPFSFSSNGAAKGSLVFAGYGITDKEHNYDDYAGLDVQYKFVLILRHEPREGKDMSSHAALSDKAVNAKMHGAKGVFLVNDVYAHDGKDQGIDKFRVIEGPTDAGIFFVQVSPRLADDWVGADRLRQATEAINRDLKPHSFPKIGRA